MHRNSIETVVYTTTAPPFPSLGASIFKTLDSRLTLREACRICATVTGFVAILASKKGGGERAGRDRPPPRRRDHEDLALAGQSQEAAAAAAAQEEEALLAVGDDSMGPEEFARAVYHCGDLKTWDGMCPVSQVHSSRWLFTLLTCRVV